MAATQRFGDAVVVDGLNETLRGLNKVNKQAAKEVKGLIREHTKPIAFAARKVSTGAPTEPSRKSTMVGYSVTNTGAAIRLRAREPRAYQTEFGSHTQPVGFESEDMYNRPQSTLRRRTTLPWGNDSDVLDGNTGYVIQPTIRRMMPKFIDDLADDLIKWVDRSVEVGR